MARGPLKTVTELGASWETGKALKLRMDGMSFGDIAKYFATPKATVIKRLRPFLGKIEDVKAYKEQRADILSAQQLRVISAITDSDIKKASLRDKVIAAATLYDKERLERGQSTGNISVLFQVADDAEKLRREQLSAINDGKSE